MTNEKKPLPRQRINRNLPLKPGMEAPPVVIKKRGLQKKEGVIPRQEIGGKIILKDDKVLKKEQIIISKKKQPAPMEIWGKKELQIRAVAQPSERYIHFRMRVIDGEMSIVDSHLVEGKLVTPSKVDGNYLYEVTLGEKRLHIDSLPDLGVRRSFTNITGTEDEKREHITYLSTYEFDVRVPEKEFKGVDLSNINIALYRTKERVKMIKPGLMSLNIEFNNELREVSRIKGIHADMLPK
jgi:hypothetical protein